MSCPPTATTTRDGFAVDILSRSVPATPAAARLSPRHLTPQQEAAEMGLIGWSGWIYTFLIGGCLMSTYALARKWVISSLKWLKKTTEAQSVWIQALAVFAWLVVVFLLCFSPGLVFIRGLY